MENLTERERLIKHIDDLLGCYPTKEKEAVKSILTTLNGFTNQQANEILDQARTARYLLGKTTVDL